MTLQERMRELRKERKETQRQVADAIGVTDRQYQRFETGVNLPGFENLVGIADHFGVSLDYLAGRSDRLASFLRAHILREHGSTLNTVEHGGIPLIIALHPSVVIAVPVLVRTEILGECASAVSNGIGHSMILQYRRCSDNNATSCNG